MKSYEIEMHNIPQNEYRANKRLSASDCKELLDNPYAFKIGYKKESTLSLDVGSVTHCLILEPQNFNRDFLVCPELNLRTKAGKQERDELELQAEVEGKKLVDKAIYEKSAQIAENVLKNDIGALFKNGLAEHSFYGEVFGKDCKCRPDFYYREKGIIIDLKTTRQGGAHPAEFAKTMAKFKYHLQARFYLELLKAKDFLFVVVETEPPYVIGCYKLDYATLDKGEELIKRAFKNYDNLESFNQVLRDSDGNTMQTIGLPNYAFFE